MESLRNFEDPVVIDLHMGTIPSEVFSIEVDTLFAHIGLFLRVGAVPALVIRVSDGTHPNDISHLD